MEKVSIKGKTNASATMLEDLSNLIAWAHNHATICLLRPSRVGSLDSGDGHQCLVAWQCEAGHAYNWPFTLITKAIEKHEKEDIDVVQPNLKRKRTQKQHDQETDMNGFDSDGSCSSQGTHFSGGNGDAEWESNFDIDLVAHEPRLGSDSQHLSPGRMLEKKTNLCVSEKIIHLTNATEDNIEMRSKNLEIQEPNEDLCTTFDEDLSYHVIPISDTESTSEDEAQMTFGVGPNAPSTSKQRTLNLQQRAALSQPTSSTSRNVKAATNPKQTEKKLAKKMVAKLGNLRSFDEWISLKSQASPPIISQLDMQLVDYFRYLREESEKENLTLCNLMCYVKILDRNPLIQSNSCNLRKSPELPMARVELAVLIEELKVRERDREMEVVQNLRLEEEVSLRQAGLLSRSNPEGLFNLVLLNNLRAFGKAHLQGPWPVRSSDLQLVQLAHPGTVGSGEKLEYLEWNPQRAHQQYPLRMHGLCDFPERCPLQDYKVYVSKRSGGFMTFQDAFYCTFKSQNDGGDSGWYTRTTMSKHRMEKVLKTLSNKILALRDQGPASGKTS